MPEAYIVRKVSQNRQRLMVYILAEIVTMIMDFLIYQQYQRNLLQAKVGLLRFVPPAKPIQLFWFHQPLPARQTFTCSWGTGLE